MSTKAKQFLLTASILLGLALIVAGLYRLSQPAPTATEEPPAPPEVTSPAAASSPVGSSVTSLPETPSPAAGPGQFEGRSAYDYVLAQTDLGPRPPGSKALTATGDLILGELARWGWITETQEFVFKGTPIRNVIGRKGSGPVLIVGAHYDTRPYADNDRVNKEQWISGANDGASGVAVLLELARVLDPQKLQNEVWLAFFDAEDRGSLDDWPWCVGSRHMAENLTVKPEAMILVDMVGDYDQQFYYERNSNLELQAEIWKQAELLGYGEHFIPQYKWSVFDDHIPFVERGIPSADIIDFGYPYWHTSEDTADKVSAESLERVGRVLQAGLEGRGRAGGALPD